MDVPDYDFAQRYAKLLEAQKIAMKNAERRKGEKPKDLPSRDQCISEHMMTVFSRKMKMAMKEERYFMMTSVIGNPYPPSVAPLESLNKVMIKDLALETHHRGSYLLLRFVCMPYRISAIMNIVEDEAGSVVLFSLYLQEPDIIRSAETVLKPQGVIILKEPYFKVTTSGSYSIRVDQPTDIIWLSDDDLRIPEGWRTFSGIVSSSAEKWKIKGNDHVGQGIFFEAIEMYSRALRSSPTAEEAEVLHNNRALAYLRIEAYDAAFWDASFVQNMEERSEKGLYRAALALCGLERYNEALEILQVLVRKHPGSALGQRQLKTVHLRVAEKESGLYNWKLLYKETRARPPRLDHASYIGPVEVLESKGRGRGLFTTKPVKAGDLLLCEKAFSYCFAAPQEELKNNSSKYIASTSVLVDVSANRVTMGTQADLIRDISNKLAHNPSLLASFEDLAHGDHKGVAGVFVDGGPVVDTFLVAKVISLNCFGSPLTTRETALGSQLKSANRDQAIKQEDDSAWHTTGLWLKASYINHSCDLNCQRSFIGDFMIVRAAKNLPAGTELVFSYADGVERSQMAKKLSQNWDFKCACAICFDERATPSAVKTQRATLLRRFRAPSTKLARKQEIIKLVEKTNTRPTSEVPRLEMWSLQEALLLEFANRGEVKKAIEQVFVAFDSLGFDIEGGRVPFSQSSVLVVKRWGFPHVETISLWRTLRDAYRMLGQEKLADQAKEYGRLSWMIYIGEDSSFTYEE